MISLCVIYAKSRRLIGTHGRDRPPIGQAPDAAVTSELNPDNVGFVPGMYSGAAGRCKF